MNLPTLLATAAFVVLLLSAVGRVVRHGHRASIWLAASFASLAVAALLSIRLSDLDDTSTWVIVGMALGLTFHPVALVRFANELHPVKRAARLGLETLAGGLFLLTILTAVTVPHAFAEGDSGPMAAVVLPLIAYIWITTTVFVGTRLLRHGRRTPSSVGRARATTMALGVLTLGPAVALPFLVPSVPDEAGTIIAAFSCALTYLGFVAPDWLRWAWSRRDANHLGTSELRAMKSSDADLSEWLATVAEVWDADTVALMADNVVVARHGSAPVIVPAVAGKRDGVEVVDTRDGHWWVTATQESAMLVVRTSRDPVLFGDDRSDLLLVTLARMTGMRARHQQEELARDATELRHLADAATLRDDVLSTLSHELRTPLVTLRGVPELLLARLDDLDPTQVRQLIANIHTNAVALHRVVDSTLLLAQSRSGEIAAAAAPLTLNDVMDGAHRRLEDMGTDMTRVIVDGPTDLATVADSRLAAVIVSEIVHNGLHYSDEDDPVHITLRDGPDGAQIIIDDDGRGMGADITDVAVLAFQRSGHVLTRDTRGVGVGITLVRELCDLMDVSATWEKRASGGTRVVIAFPRAAAAVDVAV